MREQLTKENNNKKRFLFYPWGIFVTAYARRALWSAILEFKDDYIYSDSDSIYVFDNGNHDEYFTKYNNYIINKCKETLRQYGINEELIEPMTIKKIKKPMGVWEIDKKMSKFKTCGAKRYIYKEKESNKINITVSGLNKKNAMPYLYEKYGENVFNKFNNGLYVPKGYTGKLTHTYIDDEFKIEIIDYNGYKSYVYEKSCVHLEDSDYNFSMADDYLKYLLTFT